MNREAQFMNFPKAHVVNLLCGMTDLHTELEKKLAEAQVIYNHLIDGAAVDNIRINELEKELALKNSWVKHHQGCVEICMDERSKLETRLAEAENMWREAEADCGKLFKKLEIATECLEWIAKTDTASHVHGPDVLWLTNWRNTRKQAAQNALKEITNVREKDKA